MYSKINKDELIVSNSRDLINNAMNENIPSSMRWDNDSMVFVSRDASRFLCARI